MITSIFSSPHFPSRSRRSVASSRDRKTSFQYLRHHSRALIFTASMPPASVAGVLAALDVLQEEPDRRVRLWHNTNRVAEGLRALGLDVGATQTPVIPVLIGDPIRAMTTWRALFDEGVFTHPIIPPAVPAHACRIRVSMSAEHSSEQIDRVLDAFERVARSMSLAATRRMSNPISRHCRRTPHAELSSAPMKVALVCDWFHPRVGGIEVHLRDLAARLRGAGHDVVAITPTPGLAELDGMRVHRIDAPRAPVFGFLVTRGGIRAVGHALVDERVDVAHCHVSIISPAALGGALEAVRRSVPAVVTFHSVVPQTRLLAHAVNVSLGTSRWPVCFSAVSQRVARDVRPAAGARAMTILANGIDADFWTPGDVRKPDGIVRLISVMRLNAKKRPLALVGVMRRVVAELPGRCVQLRIVGDGPQRAALERAITRAGLAERVTLLGRQSRDEIRRILAESDVFVLPTVRESFGLAALEARCAGLPVVAMRASGVAEFITHGQDGLLANSDAELARHVASLAVDDNLMTSIAEHNRRTTPAFDWTRTVDAHVSLYRDAIALRDSV